MKEKSDILSGLEIDRDKLYRRLEKQSSECEGSNVKGVAIYFEPKMMTEEMEEIERDEWVNQVSMFSGEMFPA
ncbi:unnamed protein product [Dovyalis caffra]|uniref:Uncharacterized protein n=1 Tax=Dovyalis caffra TaxID=77055 RepID=A0AAV1SBY7_9ROSI|nr:unnamed protein product [Dovyalis caffra]